MNFDLKSYVKVYPNWVNDDLCKNVVNDLSKSNWGKHSFSNADGSVVQSYDTDLEITVDLPQWVGPMHDRIWSAINQYVVEDLKFSWYKGWNGFTQVRYNRYQVNTEMHEHCDHIHTAFDGVRKGVPILSVLGCLNSDYEGGDLIMFGTEKIELKGGSIMVFPSNFLYPHKVTLVTKGTRYSYVSWVW